MSGVDAQRASPRVIASPERDVPGMNREKRTEIFTRLRAGNPSPTTELVYDSPFELLIAVILSAQATDISVNKATATLFPTANTPQGILDLGLAGLKSHIKSIGLYNSKAENIIKTCGILLREHDGEVPRDRAALEAWRSGNRRVEFPVGTLLMAAVHGVRVAPD